MTKHLSIGDLNDMVSRAERALEAHFAEMRTNILLDSGFHHAKTDKTGRSRERDAARKKIRIVKNHLQVVTKFIRNSISNRAPNCACYPRNEKELSDQKSAELNQSVYEHLHEVSQLSGFYADMVYDFVVTGETHTKVFYDPNGGEFIGWEKDESEDAEESEETEDDMDEDEDEYAGEESPDDLPVKGAKRAKFAGKILHERIPGYNFLTDPDADSMRNVKWVCIKKYLSRKELLARYWDDEEKTAIIKKSSKEKVDWFNGFTGIYSENNDDEVELRELYFPSCSDYPEGQYIYFTDMGKLESGILPDGMCIFSEVYDPAPDSPRGYSVIRIAKPFQIEINRAQAAAILESIVLGHSTVLYPSGDKPKTQGIGNGMKGLEYPGVTPPTVLPGRSGEQYIEYQKSLIDELYRVCMVPQQDEDKQQGVNDAQAMLGRSLRDKMRFSIYGEKIENLICQIAGYSLKLARRYLPDDVIIPIVGRTEAVNIAEFKNTTPQSFQLKIKPRADDFTSVYGKSLQIIQSLQYVGNQLPPEAIAGMVRKLPFLNNEAILKDFTIWEDQLDSIILSLDRGEVPFFFEQTDHDYAIKRLMMRMNENDFPTLPQEVQLNYNDRYMAHMQIKQQQQQEEAANTAGYIPSGGGLISADYYITTENGKQQRVRIPYESMDWLVKRLSSQGSDVEKISNLPGSAPADLGALNQQAGLTTEPQGQPQAAPMPMA
jgi:hypothetical protein